MQVTDLVLKNFLTLKGSLKRQTDANITEHSTLSTYTQLRHRTFPTGQTHVVLKNFLAFA